MQDPIIRMRIANIRTNANIFAIRVQPYSKEEWNAFREETKFNGPPFILAAQVDSVCHANTLIDTGCNVYGLVFSRFAERHQLKRIKIRPQSLRGFDGPTTDKLRK
ncbi:hypothetical protein V1509DRAFT_426557 [Lipomyces kononenkoae]